MRLVRGGTATAVAHTWPSAEQHATHVAVWLCLPRMQPSNILEFGARYFGDMLRERDGGAADTQGWAAPDVASTSAMDVEDTATMIDIASLSPAELEPILLSECAPGMSGQRAARLHATEWRERCRPTACVRNGTHVSPSPSSPCS